MIYRDKLSDLSDYLATGAGFIPSTVGLQPSLLSLLSPWHLKSHKLGYNVNGAPGQVEGPAKGGRLFGPPEVVDVTKKKGKYSKSSTFRGTTHLKLSPKRIVKHQKK